MPRAARRPARAAAVVIPVVVLWLVAAPRADQAAVARTALPALSNAEFWRISAEMSEPDGTFHSENLVSNEARFQAILPELVRTVVPGRAYLGVGSEQNFTYIAATRPVHVFIVDIRRGNLDLHLLYKALFELSGSRADFVAQLFSRPRPPGLTAASTANQLFDAFARVPGDRAMYDRTLAAVLAHLTRSRGFALSAGDRDGIAYVLNAWFTNGPDIRYQLGRDTSNMRGGGTNYAQLMTSADATGRNWSYLASEESFLFLKALETDNRIVPVVGNFGGRKALRAVATYLREHALTVSTFYTSNVQQYLRQDGLWNTFCANAATLPMDGTSTMIFSERGGFGGDRRGGPGFNVQLMPLRQALAGCRT